jgi:hypothetical protein
LSRNVDIEISSTSAGGFLKSRISIDSFAKEGEKGDTKESETGNWKNSKKLSEEQTEVAEGSEPNQAASVFRDATVRADVFSKRRRSPRRCSSLDGRGVGSEFLLQHNCGHRKYSAILTVTRL